MKWLPYENFYVDTNLKPDAVQSDLETEVGPDPGFTFTTIFSQRSECYFLGSVANGTFRIRRQIYYRNSFLPRITGTIEPYLNGSRVHVKMMPHILVTIFMCMWMGGVGVACLVVLFIYTKAENFNAVTLVPFGMFLFGYVLFTGGFKFESIKAKTRLAEIFQGNITEA